MILKKRNNRKKNSRYIAIGDIHGHFEKLQSLFFKLEKELNRDDVLVFLGDYVDRGPHSKEVLDFLIQISKKRTNSVFLRGNHEDMFLDYLGFSGSHGESFLYNGGGQTLHSFGGKWNVEKDHIDFLLNLKDYYVCPEYPYIFVHAGFRPGIALEDQNEKDLFWIRNEFLNYHESLFFNRKVIYGHTVNHNGLPRIHENKIGIDTGAGYSGPLTALIVPEEKIIQSEIF